MTSTVKSANAGPPKIACAATATSKRLSIPFSKKSPNPAWNRLHARKKKRSKRPQNPIKNASKNVKSYPSTYSNPEAHIMNVLLRYEFWLVAVSLVMILLERIFAYRRQPFLRPQLGQDIFWLLFNGMVWGYISAFFFNSVPGVAGGSLHASLANFAGAFRSLSRLPFIVQALLFLVAADFIEWLVHNALHRIDALWKIHRVHHSVKTMDWICNFRFHWGENIVYKSIKFLPLALLGAKWEAILIAAVISMTVGFLNHSNINVSWGPLRYIFNSANMHLWHHDKFPDKPAGYNFAVVFSLWDWLFGTALFPDHPPKEIGYEGEEWLPQNLLWRFFVPFKERANA
ncbi:MAG: hypothetical protein GF398_04800 [Chitinivibrionales bacterium]|nr:hypothetical protein [Chitinivibrionales bacterium]